MSSGSIAAIIPAYDSELFLAAALDSLRQQIRPPDEIIVVDDGSRDGTRSVAQQWAAQSPLALQVISTENRGIAAARNVGLGRATTEFIALLDADDTFLPHHLATLEQGYRRNPDLVLCFGDVEVMDLGGRILQPSFLAGKKIWEVDREDAGEGFYRLGAGLVTSLLHGSYIPIAANLFRRSAALAIGGFDPVFSVVEDQDFWLRLARQGPFAVTHQVLGRKLVHDANLSHARNSDKMAWGCVQVMRKLLAAPDTQLSAAERAEAQAALQRHLDDALYQTSRRGLKTFWKALRSAPKPTHTPWKHCLRATVYTFLNTLSPARDR
jgi:glycosyltransferase involved in cell wall biosynthesis